MTLTNIEYGSLASSATLNNNFEYLEDKIDDSSESIMTSISSILSNIATINSRLGELSDTSSAAITNLTNKLDEYKAKMKIIIMKSSMIPNWAASTLISTVPNFKATSNGYVLLNIEFGTKEDILVNSSKITLNNKYTESGQVITIPLNKGDTLSCTAEVRNAYFLPAAEINTEDL